MSVIAPGVGIELTRYVNVLSQAADNDGSNPPLVGSSRNLLLSLNSMTYDDVNNAGKVDNVHVGWEIMQEAGDTTNVDAIIEDTNIMLGNCMFPEGVDTRFIGIGVNMGYDDAATNSIVPPIDSIFIGHDILSATANPTATYTETIIIGNDMDNDGIFNDANNHNVLIGHRVATSTSRNGALNDTVGIGHGALDGVISQSTTVAIGLAAGASSDGTDCVYLGAGAGLQCIGAHNIAIGEFALESVNGNDNIAIGDNCLTNVGNFNQTIAIGINIGLATTNTFGVINAIIIGDNAVNSMTLASGTDLSDTIAIGREVLEFSAGDFSDTVVIGAESLMTCSEAPNCVSIGHRIGHDGGSALGLRAVDKTVMIGKRVLADVGSTGFDSVTNSILIGHECFDTAVASSGPVISDVTAIGFEIFKGAAFNGANSFDSIVAIGDKIGAGMASKTIRESVFVGDNVLNGNLATGTHDGSVYIGNNAMLGGTGADDKSGSVAIGSAPPDRDWETQILE